LHLPVAGRSSANSTIAGFRLYFKWLIMCDVIYIINESKSKDFLCYTFGLLQNGKTVMGLIFLLINNKHKDIING